LSRSAAGMAFLPLAVLFMALSACGKPTSREGAADSILGSAALKGDLEIVRKARVFFAHHSVGRNILDGIDRVVSEAGLEPLKCVPADRAAESSEPALIDATGGSNGDPKSKIDYFVAAFRTVPSVRHDLAIMKFCYVDFNPSTDTEKLLSEYREAIAAIKKDALGIQIAHCTVPLTVRPTGIKPSFQRLLGREEWGDACNVKRSEFNQALIRAFPDDPIFDIAGLESRMPDGNLSTFKYGGESYPCMYTGYTSDGGHLNLRGQRIIGEAFLHFLAKALASG
jgi:hypothetical protein